jgi:hypothetical protein
MIARYSNAGKVAMRSTILRFHAGEVNRCTYDVFRPIHQWVYWQISLAHLPVGPTSDVLRSPSEQLRLHQSLILGSLM